MNSPTHFSRLCPTLGLAFPALAFLALLTTAHAQSTPTAPKPEETPVKLSAFEVKSGNGGYLAAESTSGTRYAARVMDIPMSIQTVSSEFIEQFMVFDFSGQDVLNYVSGSAPTNTGSTGDISLRGIRGFAVYKNGIREGGMWGPASIDRVEVLKGANAAIYGQAEPGGMTNRITKEGTPRAFQNLRASFGSGDFSRTMLDVNQPIIKGVLFARAAGSYEDSRQYVQNDAWFHRQNLYGSMTWRIAANTTATVHAEYIKLKNNAQNTANLPFVFIPFVNNGATSFQAANLLGRGPYESFRSLNVNGPFNYNQVIYRQLDANLSHKFTDWLSLRALAAQWERKQDNFGVAITNAATGSLPAIGGFPTGGYLGSTFTSGTNTYAPGSTPPSSSRPRRTGRSSTTSKPTFSPCSAPVASSTNSSSPPTTSTTTPAPSPARPRAPTPARRSRIFSTAAPTSHPRSHTPGISTTQPSGTSSPPTSATKRSPRA